MPTPSWILRANLKAAPGRSLSQVSLVHPVQQARPPPTCAVTTRSNDLAQRGKEPSTRPGAMNGQRCARVVSFGLLDRFVAAPSTPSTICAGKLRPRAWLRSSEMAAASLGHFWQSRRPSRRPCRRGGTRAPAALGTSPRDPRPSSSSPTSPGTPVSGLRRRGATSACASRTWVDRDSLEGEMCRSIHELFGISCPRLLVGRRAPRQPSPPTSRCARFVQRGYPSGRFGLRQYP